MLECNTISPFITPKCHGLTRSHQLVKGAREENAAEVRFVWKGNLTDVSQVNCTYVEKK